MKLWETFIVFLRLGLTSFGGPVAHLGYFHDEFVKRRKWMRESEYADLVGLCQFLPGPASSQIGMAVGLKRAGILGALAAWIGFTFPSAILLVLFALGMTKYQKLMPTSWLHSLKVIAVAVVAQALWSMIVKLCPDKERKLVAALACMTLLLFPYATIQLIVIISAGLLGLFFLKPVQSLPVVPELSKISKKMALGFLLTFAILLGLLPMMAKTSDASYIKIFDSFYRTGALVFGGGHVVLPLLQAEVVPPGWVSNDAFMAGYGAAQAIPGPLFSFAAYLGAVSSVPPSGWSGAFLCLSAIFLPSFLLILGIWPFWQVLRESLPLRRAMLGINAAVVGILAAAFYNPVWLSGISNIKDLLLALFAFTLLVYWKLPSWAVVLTGAIIGGIVL